MKLIKALLLAATLVPSMANAAFCMEPRAPNLLFVSKPQKPICITFRNCTEFDLDSYRSSAKRYFEQLQQYVIDVQRFNNAALEYAECMADLD